MLLIDGEPVWDSLAICETVAELYPAKQLWPQDRARAARGALGLRRNALGLPGAARSDADEHPRPHPGKGLNAKSGKDIQRVVAIWSDCRARFGKGGPLLFGAFGIADAFYAPVVMRFQTYAVEAPPAARAYCEAVQSLAAVREWCDAARRETEFVAEDEPYAKRN